MSAPEHAAEVPAPEAGRGRGLRRTAWILVFVGAALSVLALLQDDLFTRSRFSHAYLLAFTFCWTVVVGSLFFVALQHITSSVWSITLRRVAEMLAAPVWVLAVLFVPVVLFLVFHEQFELYVWAGSDAGNDALLAEKSPYLNTTAFSIRAVLYFAIWALFAWAFVRLSLKQDTGAAGPAATLKMRKLAAPFLVLFGLSVTFASFDWLMSLEPHWYSTIFGVYVFSGMTVASLAAIALAVVWMRAKGWLGTDMVRADHLYSLGALLFGFTSFWAYIAFSQYMLIWYGNIPEETVYFAHRMEGGWGIVTILLTFIRFVVPFFLLLGRDAKSDPRRLALAGVLILLGQLVDLYWLIGPELPGAHGPVLGWVEFGPLILLVGILLLFLGRFVKRNRLVAVGDPFLEKSRTFHL